MKKLAATLLTAAAMAVVPAAIPLALAPGAHADVCGDVGGRHVDVGGCTNVVGDVAAGVAVAGDDEAAAQAASGQPPCYTAAGVPFYTPGSDPCP
jgi:hypothetical protein